MYQDLQDTKKHLDASEASQDPLRAQTIELEISIEDSQKSLEESNASKDQLRVQNKKLESDTSKLCKSSWHDVSSISLVKCACVCTAMGTPASDLFLCIEITHFNLIVLPLVFTLLS